MTSAIDKLVQIGVLINSVNVSVAVSASLSEDPLIKNDLEKAEEQLDNVMHMIDILKHELEQN